MNKQYFLKRLFFLTLFLNLACSDKVSAASTGTITLGTIAADYCKTAQPKVGYTLTDITGDVYRLELSDSNGSFANPVHLDSNNTGDSLTARFTTAFPASGYKLRVVAVGDGAMDESAPFTIEVPVSLPSIAGTNPICVGSGTYFTNTVTGGTWSTSLAAVATVNTAGLVTGVSHGTARITYSVTNSCGESTIWKNISIDTPITWLPAIQGPDSVCINAQINLSDSMTGGTWVSTNTAGATVSGSGRVTGLSAGNTDILYILSNRCGAETLSTRIFVKSPPTAGGITLPSGLLCPGTTVIPGTFGTFFDSSYWRSANTAIATVDPATGEITSVAKGWVNVLHIGTNTCGADTARLRVRVDPVVEPINGPLVVCSGQTYTYSDTTVAGTWESLNTVLADINSTTGVADFHAWGTVKLVYTADRSTCGVATDTIIVRIDTPLTISISGPSNLCVNTNVAETANYPAGTWVSTNTTVATISATGRLYGLQAGNTDVVYTVANGCGSFNSSQSDTVFALPAVTLSNVRICERASVTLSETHPSDGGSGVFSTTDGALFSVDAGTGNLVGISGGNGQVRYTYTDAHSCTNTATANVTVDTLPVITASPAMNSYLCHGSFTRIRFSDLYGRSSAISWRTVGSTQAFGSLAPEYYGANADTIAAFTARNEDSTSISVSVVSVVMMNSANGCVDSAYDTIRVYPTPVLNPMTNYVYCDSTVSTPVYFNGPLSASHFNWTFDGSSANIGLDSTHGTDSIPSFTVHNRGTDTVIARYIISASVGGCTSAETRQMQIIVRPTPRLSGILTDSVCDRLNYTYLAATASRDSSLNWRIVPVSHISASLDSGSGSISSLIHNDTTLPVQVVINYSLVARGCTNNQVLSLKVFPTPRLNVTGVTDSICDGTMFNFNSGSPTVGATFDWKRYADPDNEERIGVDGINQLLINNSDTARTIIYKYIVTANGCLDTTWTIPVVVKPTPRLHTDFSAPKYFCSSPVVPFQFTDSSNTQGAVSWTWSRASTNHINKRPFPIYWDSASGVGNNGSRSFTDTLLSDHYDTLKVHYLFHISATGCHDTEDLTVIVKPIPVIDTASFKAISTICSETVFLNAPLSKTPGISITWSRAPVDSLLADGSTLGSSGAGTSEQLLKNIAVSKPDTVIYLDTLFAYGCYNPQTVTVIVAPVPVLTRYRDSVCSNSTLSYIPVPTYSGSTYKYGWTVITNTDNASLKASGRDRINEVVSSNSILRPVSVVYKFRDTFTINNVQCYSVDNDVRNTFTAVIKPQPVKPVITSTNPDPLDSTCQNVEYLNFTNIIPIDYVDGNVVYSWTSASAQIFNSTDAKRYNCLVTIPKNMTNTLIYNTAYVSGYQECAITDTFNIHSPDASRKVDSIGVVKFGNNLICNDNTVENYVWGYEDKATLTLHRLKQKGTQLDEINQNLYLPDHPDFSTDSNYYFVWTINAGNDCRQKSYYNAPGGVFKPESTTLSTEDFRLLAFPNPAQMTVTIELDGKRLDHLEAEVYDVTGRLLVAQPMNGNLVNISLADLPDGNYLVVCRHNGYKIATSRLVKN